MPAPTESNPNPKPGGAAGGGASSGSSPPSGKDKDARGGSGLSESTLAQSVVRRGLATQEEVDRCRAYRIEKAPTRGLLDVMVEGSVLTRSQAARVLRELAAEATPANTKVNIPGYELIGKLGKGSMGVVYKARQTSLDRVVAVKVLLDSLAKNKEYISRFEREAKIAAKLSHSNIVNVIDSGSAEGRYYFVMEYVEGPTIKDELDSSQRFTEKQAVRIVLAVAEAMKHAHQRGLVHRDIKPENVILTKEGGVKLADLGLARPTDDLLWASSEAGMAIGTPYYISPEQVRGQTDVDIRADIYSLGATFYHMVTGNVPYSGDTPNEVMKKHVDKRVVFQRPDHLNTTLSGGLGDVIETMMAKDREERYRNPDDLIVDLKCLEQGKPPVIASKDLGSLASLAEGDITDDDQIGFGVSSGSLETLEAKLASKNAIIFALAGVLGISLLLNLLQLLL